MKRFFKIFVAFVFILTSFGICASAKIGDKIGTALFTDIVAYINHYAINSYIVNGQSVIVAEDLINYGFKVEWSEQARALYISRSQSSKVNPTAIKKNLIPGTAVYDVLETDISVYANSQKITSYSVNGYTALPLEELTMVGEINWHPQSRTLKMWVVGVDVSPVQQSVEILYVPMYSTDGKVKWLTPYNTIAYKNDGWLYFGDYLVYKANEIQKNSGYEDAITFLQNEISSLNTTKTDHNVSYISSSKNAYTKLIDMYKIWSGEIGSPVMCINSTVNALDSGTPQLQAELWNISGKNINSFVMEFTCFDENDKETTDFPELYNGTVEANASSAGLSIGEKDTFTMALNSNKKAKSVKDLKIKKVVFSDGTIWEIKD